MKSSSGFYRPGLDQLRGLAIYLVFCWHFIHSDGLVSLTGMQAAAWPLNVVNQGYVGVALFMVLSGYLFAGLTLRQGIRWRAFLRNRALRLLPLLSVVLIASLIKMAAQGQADDWVFRIAWGWLMPTLPQGGWSVTVEAHYYLLLPMLAWLGRRHPANWLGILLLAVCGRAVLSRFSDHMSLFGSYTILGRIDQFLLGMLAWHVRGWFKQRHIVCGLAALAYSVYVYELDHLGVPWGPRFRNDNWWIWLPTVEGLFFAMTVAWYDSSFEGRRISLPGRVAIMAGRTSYSMYLLHFFWVFAAARWFNAHVWPMSSPERGIVMASIAFLASMPIAMLSYRFIELPCLRARQSYQAEAPSGEGALPHDQPRVPEMPGAKVRRAS